MCEKGHFISTLDGPRAKVEGPRRGRGEGRPFSLSRAAAPVASPIQRGLKRQEAIEAAINKRRPGERFLLGRLEPFFLRQEDSWVRYLLPEGK